MNLCHGSVVQEIRPGTARVQVTELSGSGCINPTPNPGKQCEDSDTAVELYLSPDRLELLCGTRDLSLVTSLEVCVDTQANTLGNFGSYLPRLVQLKMNNSLITSVRDLGTTLSHLQVLWMSRCCLQDLDGISTFSSLEELYLAYNNVSDLSQISMLDNLRLLDLEGNNVDDLVKVQYLGLCRKLQTLTLVGNPVCVRPEPTSSKVDGYSYRAAVRELVPQLRYLDDVSIKEDALACGSITEEDWDILRNSIRECNPSEAAKSAESVHPYSTHSSASRPFTSPAAVRPLSSPSSRLTLATGPGVPTPLGSRPGSSDSDLTTVEAESSTLTHGAGRILFCGNPVQAIRARREQLKTAPTRSTLTPRDLPIHVPEHTYDVEEPDLGERVNVFAELRAWREQHSRRLEVIEKERSPQILAIHHGGEDETGEDEEEGFAGMRSNSSDEDQREEKHCDRLDTGSLDSSFHSLSPDLNQQEVVSPEMARMSLSPDTTLSLSPPGHCVASAPSNRKLSRVRARRLRLSQASSEHLPEVSRTRCVLQTTTPAAETDLSFERVQHLARTNLPPVTTVTQIPHPPSSRALLGGSMNSWYKPNTRVDVDLSSKHKITKIPQRPAISRPHTARAALQKHHQHHLPQPYRGSSHPD
ncbi:leucine-rich repeat-containing protein 56 isoform X2 [Kryptolebias marmoratus]|uniref:leucine-rich repeat-containing protein 56 isoform X2 n=2 Tax=Kryptolebias marmoratus TaxID=37003 RepID=UPI000D5303EC|nr:leucine-rich repeat-containing protein 56 isoform X2 [Kryptolebias marmoratus]